MDSATIAVVGLIALAAGAVTWLSVHSRRNQATSDESREGSAEGPVEEAPAAQPIQSKKRKSGRR